MAGRAFSTGSTPGEAAAAAAAATASVGDAKVEGDFPWRNAPDQAVAPAGSGSFLDGFMEAIFEEFCLKGVDFTVSFDAVCISPAERTEFGSDFNCPRKKTGPSSRNACAVFVGVTSVS